MLLITTSPQAFSILYIILLAEVLKENKIRNNTKQKTAFESVRGCYTPTCSNVLRETSEVPFFCFLLYAPLYILYIKRTVLFIFLAETKVIHL